MNSLMIRCLAVIGFGFGVLSLSVSGAPAEGEKDKKIMSIKEIMAKAHKGGKSSLESIKTALAKKDDINWDLVQSKAKDLALLAGDLGKNTPKKGEKESWEKLTTSYEDDVKKLLAAADKKEVAPAEKALGALGKSCGACHKAHK